MKSATNGIFWSGIAQYSTQIYQAVVIIILVRVLFPEDFGIIGMAVIFTELVQTISKSHLNAAIIHKQNINDSNLAASFWTKPLEQEFVYYHSQFHIGRKLNPFWWIISVIGANAIILPSITFGKYCFFGYDSVVTTSFADYSVVGIPANVMKILLCLKLQ